MLRPGYILSLPRQVFNPNYLICRHSPLCSDVFDLIVVFEIKSRPFRGYASPSLWIEFKFGRSCNVRGDRDRR